MHRRSKEGKKDSRDRWNGEGLQHVLYTSGVMPDTHNKVTKLICVKPAPWLPRQCLWFYVYSANLDKRLVANSQTQR
jgi:hypothetical protein